MSRRACMPAASRRLLLPVAVIGGVIVAAQGCKGPISPPSPRGVFLAERGTSQAMRTVSLANPGDTKQLTAFTRTSDGTLRDVTAEATWQSTDFGVVTVTGGTLTAVAYGSAKIAASWRALSSGSTEVRVRPDGTFLISGSVTVGDGVAVGGAAVQAKSPLRTFSTTTGYDGRYVLPAASGDITLTVDKEGYVRWVKQLTMLGDERSDVALEPIDRTTRAVAGDYTLSIAASPSCTMLPAQALRTTYPATITERPNGMLIVALGGQAMAFMAEFTGARSGTTVQFGLTGYYAIMGVLSDVASVVYSGTATGTIGDRGIAATFGGTIEFNDSSQAKVRCQAADHRMEFVRSGG